MIKDFSENYFPIMNYYEFDKGFEFKGIEFM